ncbi:MAG TPA: PqqD family protein [Candidatus Binatia bacterium]|nr:PqqD family protein [Candidatus Binatia bacterium]
MTIRISDDVLFRDLSGEAVILNLSSGVYFGLDEVGTRMWDLFAEHGACEKVIQILLGEYQVEETRLRQDVDDLIRQLSEKGLVKIDTE